MSAMHLKNVFSISFLSQQIRAVGTGGAIASNILADQFTLLQIWGRLCIPTILQLSTTPIKRQIVPSPTPRFFRLSYVPADAFQKNPSFCEHLQE